VIGHSNILQPSIFQFSDTAGWATGMALGLQKLKCLSYNLQWFPWTSF